LKAEYIALSQLSEINRVGTHLDIHFSFCGDY
jgi:hypothetical protein